MVGDDLGDRKCSFDSETNAAQQTDIGAEVRNGGKVDDKKGCNEVTKENPIPAKWGQSANIHIWAEACVVCWHLRLGAPPLPEVIWSAKSTLGPAERRMFYRISGSVVQSDLQESGLGEDHHHCLRQEGSRVVLSKPIEDPDSKESVMALILNEVEVAQDIISYGSRGLTSRSTRAA